MKWLVVIAFIIAAGAWVNFLKTDRRSVFVTGFLFGFLLFVMGPWHLIIAPMSFPGWGGYAKGWEVSFVDIVALSVLMANRFKVPTTPLKWPVILYVLAVAISVPMGKFLNFSAAYLIQLVRMLIVFMAVARVASHPDGARAIFYGLVLGLGVQCGFALVARGQGAIQTGGSFGHQNLLGYVTHLVLLPSFALMVGGRWPRFAMLGVLVGGCVVILTASRAAIAVAGFGIVLTYFATATINWTSRKGAFGLITLVLMLAAIPLAQESLGRRFAKTGGVMFSEDGEREAFEKAAGMMIKDHPFGVGPNHYVYMANVGHYNDNAGVIWALGSRSANVHNSYLLVHAESGFLGALALYGLLGSAIVGCFMAARKYRTRANADLLTGIGCGIACIALHSKFEWMFVMPQAQYILFVVMGLASGCMIQNRIKPKPRKRRPPLEADDEDAPVQDQDQTVVVT